MSKIFKYLMTGNTIDENDFSIMKKDKVDEFPSNAGIDCEIDFEKNDIKALIMAATQVLLPYFIGVVVVFTLFILFITEIYLKQ